MEYMWIPYKFAAFLMYFLVSSGFQVVDRRNVPMAAAQTVLLAFWIIQFDILP